MPLPSRRASLAVPTCYAAMTVLAIAMNLMPVCLPILSSGLGGSGPLTKEQLGRISAVTFIGVVGSLLVNGFLANRYPVKWFTVGGCFLISLGLVLLSVSHSYGQVLLAVTVLGLGGGTLDMILSPVVCALQPERRTIAMNWLHSFYCVGAVLTILSATLALGSQLDWHTLALFLGIIPIMIGLFFFAIPLPPLVAEDQERSRVRDLIFHRYFLLMLAAIFFGGATEMGVAQWLPSFAELDLKTTTNVGGLSLLAFSVAMALGRMLIGLLHRNLSINGLMIGSCALTALLLMLAGLCPSSFVALSAAIISGLTGSCLWPSTLGLVGDRYPLAGASMFGLMAAAGNAGGIFMPWAVGIVADHSTIGLGLAASAIAPLLMLFSLLLLRRENAKPALGLPSVLS